MLCRFENELKLLLILSSKSRYILQPVGAVKDAPVYGILEPFCELGSLGILLHAAKAKQCPSGKIEDLGENPCILSAPARICAAHDLICAVSYCHTESIIIRDIKPENMLVVSFDAALFSGPTWTIESIPSDRSWALSAN